MLVVVLGQKAEKEDNPLVILLSLCTQKHSWLKTMFYDLQVLNHMTLQ